jgi:gas vesicle protein
MVRQSDSSGAFILGFIVGAAIGAARGLLDAPQSGSETRDQLRARLSGARTRTGEMTVQTRQRVAATAHKAQEDAQVRLHRLENQAHNTLEQTQWRVQQSIDRLESAG